MHVELNNFYNFDNFKLSQELNNLAQAVNTSPDIEKFCMSILYQTKQRPIGLAEKLYDFKKLVEKNCPSDKCNLGVVNKICTNVLRVNPEFDNYESGQIDLINTGEILLEELLKGYTEKQALQWLIGHPEAKAVERVDLSKIPNQYCGDDLYFDNECLDRLTINCPNLKHLCIRKRRFSKLTAEALKFLDRVPELETLSVSIFEDPLKCLPYLPFLTTLEVTESRIEADSLIYLKNIPNVRKLSFRDSYLEDDVLIYLEYTPLLEHLDLYFCNWCDKGTLKTGKFRALENVDFLKNLKYVTRLRSLNIEACKIASETLKYLEYTKELEFLSLAQCRLKSGSLENLKYVSKIQNLSLYNNHSIETEDLQNFKYISGLKILNISSCPKISSLKHLSCLPFLESLDISRCEGLEIDVLKYLDLTPNLTRFEMGKLLLVDKEMLPLLHLRNTISLDAMTDWENYVVRKSAWNNSWTYKNSGNQKTYGQKLQQATILITDLIKKGASFKKVYDEAAALRRFIALELDHNEKYMQGLPRTESEGGTKFSKYSELYRELGIELKKIDEELRVSPTECPFYRFLDAERGVTIGMINGKEFELSLLDFKNEILEHTHPEFIAPIMEYVEELYIQALKETDKQQVQEIAGLIFWWICQAKPWRRGDPSIAEMIVRALFISKGIPNHPWKEGIIPWGEAMKVFDPHLFSKGFSNLFF